MMLKRNFIFGIFTVLSILFFSCVTMADYNFKNINNNLENANYPAVYAELEKPSRTLYSSSDKVLESLDKGLLSHYAQEYERSNTELSEAEKLIFKYYSKSVTQSIASIALNDTVIDYAGDPYENIYTNIFMALNYIQLERIDDAFVEIRRFDNKLKEIQQKYQVELAKQKQDLAKNSKSIPDASFNFHNSALARYLSMILYASEGDFDSAKVDYKYIQDAFVFQKDIYNFEFPKDIENQLSKPKQNDARVNLLAFSGLSPIKNEENIPLFAVDGFYKIALPVMQNRKSKITDVEMILVNKETGEIFSSDTQKIESIENIAQNTYQAKYATIVAKTIARMVSKLAASTAMDVAAKETKSSELSLVFTLIGAVTKVNMFVSERADVRCCRYFPANCNVTFIDVPKGEYDITVNYKNGKKDIQSLYYSNVAIKENQLNLVESFSFK